MTTLRCMEGGGGAGGAGPDPANVRIQSRPSAASIFVRLGDPTRAQASSRTEMAKVQGPLSPLVVNGAIVRRRLIRRRRRVT